jgi:hypothetical protein
VKLLRWGPAISHLHRKFRNAVGGNGKIGLDGDLYGPICGQHRNSRRQFDSRSNAVRPHPNHSHFDDSAGGSEFRLVE